MVNCASATSLLFLVPAIYAFYVLPTPDVGIACLICLFTSIVNHYNECKNKLWQSLDVTVVRAIATIYVLHTIITMRLKPFAILVYVLSALTVGIYLYLYKHHNSVDLYTYHYLVHIFAITGVVAYIHARHKYLKY